MGSPAPLLLTDGRHDWTYMGPSPTRISPSMTHMTRTSLLATFLFLAGCGEGIGPGFGGGGLTSVSTSTCASGMQWQGGESSSAMSPGQDCIACHDSGEGPHYTIAGTVYSDPHAKNDCGGSSGVTVEITGADGKVLTLTTNEAGNFYSRAAVAMPFTARVRQGNNMLPMAAAQSTGACNSCHTELGANAAPGRILAPGN